MQSHHLSEQERSKLREEAVAFVDELFRRDEFLFSVRDKQVSARDLLRELSERFADQGGAAALYEAFPDGPVSETIRILGRENVVHGMADFGFGSRL